MYKVSIHLVTWNGQKYIEECLNSILAQTFKDYFLLIIDSGSADQTVKIIEENFVPFFKDQVRFLKNKSNLGFAKTHNQAILWTDSEYILILNQDVILEPNFLKEMVEFMDANKRVGSVTGKVMRWYFQNSEDLKNSQKSDIIDSLGLKIFKSQRTIELATGEQDSGQYQEVKEIFGVSASCSLYRRQALNDIRFHDEFFDNDFFSYKEDVDLAYRLCWRAWQCYYLPSAVAYHDRTAKTLEKISNWELIKLRKNKSLFVNYHSYKNHLFLLIKNLSRSNLLRYFVYIFFYELKKFFYILFFEWSTLAGLKEFFVKRKKIKEKRKFIMKNRLLKEQEIRKWFN